LLVLAAGYEICMIALISRDPYIEAKYVSRQITEAFIYSGVVAMECVFYWVFRHRLQGRQWIRLHIILLYVAFIMLRLLTFVIIFIAGFTNTPALYEFFSTTRDARYVLYWSVIVAGHLCFIVTIVKTFKFNSPRQEVHESPDLLDEFAQ
jgi:hypothetical protein